MIGRLFDIEHGSFVDGPGLRTVVFFKGCNLRCAWCHNPESQSRERQLAIYHDKCTGCGKCMKVCPSPDTCILCGKCELLCPTGARKIYGEDYTVDAVMEQIEKDRDFYGDKGGVTCSGGECLLQPEFLTYLLKACKDKRIHTAVDTAGHVPYDVIEQVLPYTDLFLYDIKTMDDAKHQQYVGVSNSLILENLNRLLDDGAKVWVRVPIVAGINDTESDIRAIVDFVDGRAERIELLPYHSMGENKYAALGRPVQTFTAPSAELMDKWRTILKESTPIDTEK